jgi:hypothetical protein
MTEIAFACLLVGWFLVTCFALSLAVVYLLSKDAAVLQEDIDGTRERRDLL